ncbi:hypothetical protein [Massilia sp. Leaf139]|uniref:hypothetical protein n=1 Tax=Massilia sp. Leaf139 TaxID=1736272 RepID=UPI0006FE2606|nr:hypothetical protein [Massilia sp. Leaf139]KQQ86802.1 hypothetical protein ASF77_19090 [Massilia sp. Leaf139]
MSRRAAAGALLALACTGAWALPSTFGPVIGSALLCRSQLENVYFHSYLTTAFGPAKKQEGGALWFKGEATLWGKQVLDLMVSDDTHPMVFIAAVLDSTPEALEEAIRAQVGVQHRTLDAAQYPLRVSNAGSVIAYQNGKSKIYCARYKPLPPGR